MPNKPKNIHAKASQKFVQGKCFRKKFMRLENSSPSPNLSNISSLNCTLYYCVPHETNEMGNVRGAQYLRKVSLLESYRI